jgi:hypothetical protein
MAPAGAIGHAALLVASCVAFAPKSCGIGGGFALHDDTLSPNGNRVRWGQY